MKKRFGKNWFKRVLSFALVFAMSFSMLPTNSWLGTVVAKAATEWVDAEVVTNGGFTEGEDGTTGWSYQYIDSEKAYVDSGAFKFAWVDSTTSSSSAGIEKVYLQQNVTLPAGTYQLTFKTTGVGWDANFYAKVLDSTSTALVSTQLYNSWDTAQSMTTDSFTVETEGTYTISFESTDFPANGGPVSVTDVVINKQQETSTPTPEVSYSVSVSPSAPESTAGEGVALTATVTKTVDGVDSTITNLEEEGLYLWWYAQDSDTTKATLSNYDSNSGRSLTATATAPSAGTYHICTKLQNSSWTTLVDEAVSATITATAAEEGGEGGEEVATPLLTNGDFETASTTGWTITTGSEDVTYTVKTDSWATNNTTNFLNFNNAATEAKNLTVSQTIADAEAGTYKLSLKYEGVAGTSGLTVEVLDAASNVLAQQSIPATTGWDAWESLSIDNIVHATAGNLTVKISGDLPASYWGDLDDIKLELSEGSAPAIENDDIYVKKIDGLSSDFIKGIDISSYLAEVDSGVVYKDWDGNAIEGKDFIKLFAAEGVNYIRLRVWNDPQTADGKTYGGGNNDLATTLELCEMIKEYNDAYASTYGEVKVLIDLQYSDFWADPEKQTAPKAWKNMTLEQKKAAVSSYTQSVLEQVDATGVTVGMVQIGNETNTGICGESTSTSASSGYIQIFKAGCEAVDAYNEAKGYDGSEGHRDPIKKVVHFTDPHTAGTYFAQALISGGVDYDVYATSYYPFWHGTTANLKSMLTSISELTNASGNHIEVMVAETQYVYTNEDYDGSDNQAYEGKDNIDLTGWAVSVQGQANEIRDVMAAVAGVGDLGIGMFYWEPAWLGVGNAYNADGTVNETALAANKEKWETYGSGWATDIAGEYDPSANQWGGGGTNNENASLFDFYGNPLPSLHVFSYVNSGAYATEKSFYRYEALDAVTVRVGSSATEIKEALPTETTVIYNDGSTATVTIGWPSAALNAMATQISLPTAIGGSYTMRGILTVDETSYNVICTINVDPAENLLTNGDFEETLGTEWTISDSEILYQNGENPRNQSTKDICIHVYSPTSEADENGIYTSTISQTVTVPAGIYEARAFFEGGDSAGSGTGEAIYISAAYGDTFAKSDNVTLAGWMNWKTATVSNIQITEEMVVAETNKITLTANVSLANNSWGSIDDFFLYKLSDLDVEEDIESTVSVGDGAPQATLATNLDTLADLIFTSEQGFTQEMLAAIASGRNAKVIFVIQNIADSVTAEELSLITSKVEGYQIGMLLDLTIKGKVEGFDAIQIRELGDKIAISITLPEYMIATDNNVTRTYAVVRIHDGQAEVLEDVTVTNGVLTFATDRFSTYSIVYKDVAKSADNGGNATGNTSGNNEGGAGVKATNAGSTNSTTGGQSAPVPKTGDTPVLPYVLLLAACGGVFGFVIRNKKRKDC